MPDLTIVLAGKVGVGKTTLFKRIQTGRFVELSLAGCSTEEMEHHLYKVTLKDKEFKINLWDTGGLERYHSEMTSSYFHYAHAVILVYDASTDDLSSLFALKDWISEARKSSFLKDRVTFSLWANKSDLVPPNSPISDEVNLFLSNYSIPESLYFRTSSLTDDDGVVQCLDKVIEHVYDSTCNPARVVSMHGESTSPKPVSNRGGILHSLFQCCH